MLILILSRKKMNQNLKSQREQFHHGHGGSETPFEVFALTIILQLSHILYESFLFAIPGLREPSSRIFRIVLDFFLVYSPFILSLTILNQHIYSILIVQIVIIFANFFIYTRNELKQTILSPWNFIKNKPIQYGDTKRFIYLSNMMSSLLLATCLAIFAVDFPVFDRRFAKTEMYGWSLMDVGVGGFIAINGSLSPESRAGIMQQLSIKTRLLKTLRSAAPLLVLGLIRLYSVKSLNYQEHVSEYGLHWNFFFTICFVKVFASLICTLFDNHNLFIWSIVIIILHQMMLKSFGTDLILNLDRSSGLLAANKEGLISLIGFVALYLFYLQIGRTYIPPRKKLKDLLSIILHFMLISVQSLIIMFASHNLVEPISRREANLSFICFMITLTSINISIEISHFVWLQLIEPKFEHQSFVFKFFNRQGLLIFLVANLITGSVNLTMNTMIVDDWFALIIIHLYAASLTLVGFILDKTLSKNKKH